MSKVRPNDGSLAADQYSDPNHAQERPYFHGCKNVLHSLPVLEAIDIGPGQERNDQQRDQLSSGERQSIRRQDMDGTDNVVCLCDLWPQHTQIAGESNRRSAIVPV